MNARHDSASSRSCEAMTTPATDQSSFQSPMLPHAAGSLVVNPAAIAALVASAVIATAFSLGVSWLGAPILGLPLGLYLIAASSLMAGMLTRRWHEDEARITPGVRDDSPIEPHIAAPGTATWGVMEVASAVARGAKAATATVLGEAISRELEDCAVSMLRQWPARGLRIGVQGPRSLGSSMAAAIDPSLANWFAVEAKIDPTVAMRRRGLDAVVSVEHGLITVRTPAHVGRDAAWHNWSTARPISFLSAFPLRIDGEQFELYEEPADNAAQVLGCLVTLMAATARSDARIDLADRLRGRVMMPRMANAALRSLVKQARRYGPTFGTDDLSRATARVLSAASASEAFNLDDSSRRSIAELAARLVGDEPEVMLRVGAARLADMEDESGLDAMLRAERMLRDARVLPGVDHGAFVLAEINSGAQGPMGLGRVAAALTLTLSQVNVDEISFIAGDVIDDLRHCEWLIGRDQDCATLERLCRAVEKARRGEVFALPQRLAA